MAADSLPVLIAGDVHGNLQRLFGALKRYPADRWRTVFLGDLVDYGVFGIGALRYARDRPNTDVLLGNHEVALLWALRDPARVGWWMAMGGQRHDLEELRQDAGLQRWLRERPALLRLGDGTLVQHCGNDSYLELADDPDAINAAAAELVNAGSERLLWDLLSGANVFESQPSRLARYLDRLRAVRVVFGHRPERGRKPLSFHGGRALNFEGGVAPLPGQATAGRQSLHGR
jgi:Calcineurin-like phosphoesterase